jgi:predicted alpha/beta superfamily hydrolase
VTKLIDRRQALALAGGIAAVAPVAAHAAGKAPGQFEPLPLPVASAFPRTRYFEIDSVKAGARYAVWVTVPSAYEKEPTRSFPTVYMPDGNGWWHRVAGLTETAWDLIDAFIPTIQVSVGYPPADAERSLAVRARDLLPPNEPSLPGLEEGVQATVKAGLLDQAGGDLYVHNLRNPAGDRFLAFLSEELHPFIARTFRVQADDLSLFGHSYGGLFATYAALQPSTIYKNFGASSPGILRDKSKVFGLYADALAKGGVTPRNLHMSLCTREITDPTIYQPMVGAGSTAFMELVGSNPLKGLTFTSTLIPNETHISVAMPSVYSFMRAYYLKRA